MSYRKLEIQNIKGLHARASAKLVEVVETVRAALEAGKKYIDTQNVSPD